MAGVMQAALGSILLFTRGSASYMLRDLFCPLWLGALFVGFGVSSILTEKYPRPCVLLFNSIFNLAGVAMSIVAIVWYSSQFDNYRYTYMLPCSGRGEDYYWSGRPTTTPNPQEDAAVQRCLVVRQVLQWVVFGLSVVMVVLAALGLFLGLSSTILSIKALRSPRDKSESTDLSTPLLEDDGNEASQYDQE
ncbi:transmembrane protein 176A [Boleophthalmus pectinirostris]|uniref:transmembrane protein 176A n=1 Tax=Boleophthalmus pectinirostris TaxID=150288 RepID=UPI00242DA4CF|nr:transmembrane protein 176A [Boleophthalmus pectinirostris]